MEMGKVLFVDDSPLIRNQMMKLLKKSVDRVELASSGPEALEKIEAGDFDLVLLDIEMPEMNGFEVCGRLRSEEKTRLLPQIVFFSSHSHQTKKIEGLNLGVSDFIEKKLAVNFPDEFFARINAHLKISRLMRDKLELEKLGVLRATAVSVSHEVGNPLQAISLALGRIRSSVQGDPKMDRYYEAVETNIKRISEILQKLANAVNATTSDYAGGVKMIDIKRIWEEE